MENEIYKTRDLAEAAALLVSKQRLIQILRIGKICWFLFEDKEKCLHVSSEYFFGELIVNAREYYQAITRLKNRIFAGT
jgi:hypothetical protein